MSNQESWFEPLSQQIEEIKANDTDPRNSLSNSSGSFDTNSEHGDDSHPNPDSDPSSSEASDDFQLADNADIYADIEGTGNPMSKKRKHHLH